MADNTMRVVIAPAVICLFLLGCASAYNYEEVLNGMVRDLGEDTAHKGLVEAVTTDYTSKDFRHYLAVWRKAVLREKDPERLGQLLEPVVDVTLGGRHPKSVEASCFHFVQGAWRFDPANKPHFRQIIKEKTEAFLARPQRKTLSVETMLRRLLFYSAVGRCSWGLEQTKEIINASENGPDLKNYALLQIKQYENPEADQFVIDMMPWEEENYNPVAMSHVLRIGGEKYYPKILQLLKKTSDPDVIGDVVWQISGERYGGYPYRKKATESTKALVREAVLVLRRKKQSDNKDTREAARYGIRILTTERGRTAL